MTPDRQWFADHPHRRYRIRKPMGGEPPCDLVLVRQVCRGVRMRRDVWANPALGRDVTQMSDAELAALWTTGEMPMTWGAA